MTEKPRYGPANPHPLSQLKTELVWEGKYDEYGNRRVVDIAGCAMPMQKIETIDEPRSRAAAEGQIELFEKTRARIREESGQYAGKPNGRNGDFRNRLIWGDNKPVMASLLSEFKGKIDLIYIDPPFDVGADFTMDVPIGDGKETVFKDQSVLELVAFNDMWGKGTDSYLHMMFERLTLMKELLTEKGSIYVHCDWRMNSFLRIVLNDAFGGNRLINELIWKRRTGYMGTYNRYGAITDSILWYSKGEKYTFNLQTIANDPGYLERFKYRDEKGRLYRLDNLTSPNPRPNLKYVYKGFSHLKMAGPFHLNVCRKWNVTEGWSFRRKQEAAFNGEDSSTSLRGSLCRTFGTTFTQSILWRVKDWLIRHKNRNHC